jgi:hypothetical protein
MTQIKVIYDIFSTNLLKYFLDLPETITAKQTIDEDPSSSGQITFRIQLTPDLQDLLYELLGIRVDSVPLRWIKGDTKPHIDKGSTLFEKTYLVYLTDSPGSFFVGTDTYEICQGSAFVFDEGIEHETKNTGTMPRLLLGPMSEKGIEVGSVSTNISGPSGTSAYIKQEGSNVYYSYDLINWNNVFNWPIVVLNSDITPTSHFGLKFITDISLFSSAQHFIVGSSYVQIGERKLKPNGTPTTITLDDVFNYPGIVQNSMGHSYVNIFNIDVVSILGTYLSDGCGWIVGNYFAQNGATSNYIVNCSSNGNTSLNSGGIVGEYAANNGGTLYIIGCSSSGEITGSNSGGIVGQSAGYLSGNVFIYSCWSEGSITGDGCGGIVGSLSYNSNISYCYSTGIINGTNAGGIVGANSGITNTSVAGCYSTGNIEAANSGGICGSLSPSLGDTYTISITNCYSSGNLNNTFPNSNGGVCGILIPGSGTIDLSISNCYTTGTIVIPTGYFIGGDTSISGSGTGYTIFNSYSESGSGGTPGSWNNSHSNSVLIGYPSTYPGVGTTWISTAANNPYKLFEMGYTPYSNTNIDGIDLVRVSTLNVSKGSSTQNGIVSGLNYFILQKTGGTPSSYGTITINSITGSIKTTSLTAEGTYTIYLYNTGSYNITTIVLNVTNPSPTFTTPFPGHRIAFNQKSSFCGTRAVSTAAVGLGAMRGIGSYKRIVNTSK